jgi:NitT/TauT family transport system substrate-binding protein
MFRRLGLLILLGTLLAACAGVPAQLGGGQTRAITMAMPYIPNVQFAPFYIADKKGYYAAEGLKVSFDYNFQTDVVERVTQGTVQFGNGSGPDVLLARAQGRPIVSVATYSQRFPVVF